MARQTLTVQLMHAQAEIERLNAKLVEQSTYVDVLIDEINQLKAARPARRELPLHFQKAREHAMRTGTSVRVATV